HNVKIFFNPAPFGYKSVLPQRYIEILAPNEIEAAALLGVDDYLSLLPGHRRGLWTKLGMKNTIVTLGELGGEWFEFRGRYLIQPAIQVESVDTVGAGDAFCGILAALLSEGMEMEPALHSAHYGAALSTTKRGAQKGLLSREELMKEVK
ncbi:MAG: PfkB family carbohydrate kinase, partial [Candidatus Electryonea clarkiae]|nr:PfkB family carbohydrate kinase [Candidatus Electryonea clarkiae]